VALVEDEIAYHGSVGNVGPSTNILDPSTRWDDIGPLTPIWIL